MKASRIYSIIRLKECNHVNIYYLDLLLQPRIWHLQEIKQIHFLKSRWIFGSRVWQKIFSLNAPSTIENMFFSVCRSEILVSCLQFFAGIYWLLPRRMRNALSLQTVKSQNVECHIAKVHNWFFKHFQNWASIPIKNFYGKRRFFYAHIFLEQKAYSRKHWWGYLSNL